MPRRPAGSSSFNMGSSRSDGSGKERLKWTQELHVLFEKAVNQLGGPDRATPKGILKAMTHYPMSISGLTIYHVKSISEPSVDFGYEHSLSLLITKKIKKKYGTLEENPSRVARICLISALTRTTERSSSSVNK